MGTDPFAVLGLERRYDLDSAQLERRYRQLQKALHPDRHAAGTASERRSSLSKAVEVNQAYRTLKDDLARAQALLKLLGGDVRGGDGASDPEFLMEMMELRESLGEAKASADLERVRGLAKKVEAMRAQAVDVMSGAFAEVSAGRGDGALATVADALGRLKFYARFMDEVSSIEEEALG